MWVNACMCQYWTDTTNIIDLKRFNFYNKLYFEYNRVQCIGWLLRLSRNVNSPPAVMFGVLECYSGRSWPMGEIHMTIPNLHPLKRYVVIFSDGIFCVYLWAHLNAFGYWMQLVDRLNYGYRLEKPEVSWLVCYLACYYITQSFICRILLMRCTRLC